MAITEEEKQLIAQIVCDNETGNHLLGRHRHEGYWQMREEILNASRNKNLSQRETELLEYMRQYADHEYYKSLSPDKRLF